MWQYNYDYLCHKATYKYIDKYRDKRGNWVYIYNEPETGKRKQFSGVPTSQKQKMVEANRRGAEAAEKARGMAYGNNSGFKVTTKLPNGKQLVERGAVIKGNKIRFSNKTPRDLSDYDKAERTKQALKNATDKAIKRQKQYEANAKGAEAAEKARGENYKLQRENKKTTRNNTDSPAVSEEYLQELRNNTSTKDEYEGAQSKDLNDRAKAERTKQALRKATLNTKMSSLSNSDKTDIMRKATGDKYLSSSDANKLFSQFKKELLNNLVDPSAASTEYLQELYSNTRQNKRTTRNNTDSSDTAKEQLSVAYSKIDDAKKQILKGNYDKASEILNEGLKMSNEAITMGELGDNNYMDLVNEMLRDPKVNKKIYKDKVLFAPTYRK